MRYYIINAIYFSLLVVGLYVAALFPDKPAILVFGLCIPIYLLTTALSNTPVAPDHDDQRYTITFLPTEIPMSLGFIMVMLLGLTLYGCGTNQMPYDREEPLLYDGVYLDKVLIADSPVHEVYLNEEYISHSPQAGCKAEEYWGRWVSPFYFKVDSVMMHTSHSGLIRINSSTAYIEWRPGNLYFHTRKPGDYSQLVPTFHLTQSDELRYK
jgi:hypothetical protein